MSNYKPFDDRQITNRSILQELFPWVGNQTLDVLMSSIDADLTPPLKVDAQNPISLTVNVGSVIVPNPESNRNHSISFINNVLPVFTGGSVTFPSASGGNITTSTGGSFLLTLPSGDYVQVLLYMDQTSKINALIGIPNATLSLALVPDSISNTLPFAYVTLQNIAGTIQNVAQDDIFQFVGGGGAGGGTGGINYITNPDAEASTLNWNLYKNTAANIPLGAGTGGTPTGLTFTRSTTSPLRGLASFLLVQANSTNDQGEGVSTDFTIDPADQASVLSISFNYNASNTFVPGNPNVAAINDGTTTTSAGNSDVEVFVYDITNATLLAVTPEIIQANGSNNFSFSGFFQTATNSLNYRLILHVATANANATGWQLKFDNVVVGPQSAATSTSITPTQTVLTSGSGTYSPPSGCSYIKVTMVGGGGGGGNLSTNGGPGSASTFGTSLLIASGGDGSSYSGGGAPVLGGSGTINSPATGIVIQGGSGSGSSLNSSEFAGGADGGNSYFGGGGGAGNGNGPGSAGAPNTGGGGGGSGQQNSGQGSGGGGAAGGTVIAQINNPSGSYSYSVGPGGAAGGTSGGSGVIVIDEYYVDGVNNSESVSNKVPTIQTFLSGSGTYVTPFPTPLYIEVEMVGGGGGGGGAGSSSVNGTSGGQSTFGSSLLTANGGAFGIFGSISDGGTVSVGVGANAIVAVSGGQGQGNTNNGSASIAPNGGQGGVNPFGGNGGGGAGSNTGNGGDAASNTGAGGGGGGPTLVSATQSGSGGGAGGYIKAIIPSPSATYSYSVGAGGTAGTNSVSNGGSGGSGVIIVREYYTGNGGVQSTNFKKAPTIQTFLSGSGAYVTPFPTPLYLKVKMVGGGGGGGGGGTGASNGTAGANTTFGASLLIAGGGSGSGLGAPAGAGGIATVNGGISAFSLTGSIGGSGGNQINTGQPIATTGGAGGTTVFGGAGYGGSDTNGGNGTPNTGAGGGGGDVYSFSGTNTAGGGGGSGAYIEALITSILSSYAYIVGGGGNGGSAGSSGSNGGAGGSGVIIVEEYYQ